jgi:hypothetical protein
MINEFFHVSAKKYLFFTETWNFFQCDQKYLLINKYCKVISKLHPSQCFPAFKTNQQYIIFVTLKAYYTLRIFCPRYIVFLPLLRSFVSIVVVVNVLEVAERDKS